MDLWYSNWEQQCVEALESEPDYESQLHNEKELYSQQMWTKFQTTASAIAQLYKGDTYTFPQSTYVSHTSDDYESPPPLPPPPPRLPRSSRELVVVGDRVVVSLSLSLSLSLASHPSLDPAKVTRTILLIRVAVPRDLDSFVLVTLGAVVRRLIDP